MEAVCMEAIVDARHDKAFIRQGTLVLRCLLAHTHRHIRPHPNTTVCVQTQAAATYTQAHTATPYHYVCKHTL